MTPSRGGEGGATPSHRQGEEEEEFPLLILFDAAELWVREALMTPRPGQMRAA